MHSIINILGSSPKSDSPQETNDFAVFFTLSNLPTAEVGARVRALRKLADLSQEDVAEQASGFLPEKHRLSQSDISRLENNPGSVKFSTVRAVCQALSRSISDLLEETPVALTRTRKESPD